MIHVAERFLIKRCFRQAPVCRAALRRRLLRYNPMIANAWNYFLKCRASLLCSDDEGRPSLNKRIRDFWGLSNKNALDDQVRGGLLRKLKLLVDNRFIQLWSL